MILTRNFHLSEFIITSTGMPNQPTEEEIKRLFYLAAFILQPIRDKIGPIIISSGYRSEAVNRAVGGVPDSQHRLGEAADFGTRAYDLKHAYRWIVEDSGLIFGQCIYEQEGERRWIHISLPRIGQDEPQALIYRDGAYSVYQRGMALS